MVSEITNKKRGFMKIVMVRQCPECQEFLKIHPSLNCNITMRQGGKGWYHTSPRGRSLHKLVIK